MSRFHGNLVSSEVDKLICIRSSSACANACVSPLMEFMIFCLFIFPNYTECPKKTYVLGFLAITPLGEKEEK